MDIVTHSLGGVLIGSFAVGKRDNPYPYLLAGFLGASLPDADAIMGVLAWLDLMSMDTFSKYHRLLSHTVLATPFIAVLAAAFSWKWARKRYGVIYLIAFLGVVSHMIGDMVCLWPLKIMWPFSDHDYSMNLFANKDTSYVVLTIFTVCSMAMLYRIQKMQDAVKAVNGADEEEKPDPGD